MIYDLAITFVNNVGPVLARKLVAYCGGTAEAVFAQKKHVLAKIPGIGMHIVNAIKSQEPIKRAEEELNSMVRNQIELIRFTDKKYPEKLKHCADSPYLIYAKGRMDLNNNKVLSIVGTRKTSSVGLEVCKKIVDDLKGLNLLIVSGLAYGADICAHKAAVNSGIETVGVLAHGLDRIYPSVHKNIAENMKLRGGVISEFPTGAGPERENFPKRNRIIAGLADATLVVETGLKGGAMITARIANSYNRDVLAIPGNVNNPTVKGCNFLIKNNEAALIESAEDIVKYMNWENTQKNKNIQVSLFMDLTKEEQSIVSYLESLGATGIDKLCFELKQPLSKIASVLLNLELKGVIRSMPGKMFVVI